MTIMILLTLSDMNFRSLLLFLPIQSAQVIFRLKLLVFCSPKLYHYYLYSNYCKYFFFQLLYLVPCQRSAYEVGIQTYDKLSGVNIQQNITNSTDTEENEVNLQIFYGTTDVKVSSTSFKIDLATFISSVGGNLGLFVGFSVLGGLFFIYDIFVSRLFMNV